VQIPGAFSLPQAPMTQAVSRARLLLSPTRYRVAAPGLLAQGALKLPGVDPRLDRTPFWTNSLPSLFRSLIMDPKCDLMYPST
jgi:hypothetical protein